MSEKVQVAITTIDNPFNPFTEFDKWYMFDCEKNYNSCEYLARIAKTSDSLTDDENQSIVEEAIDEIINNDPFNIYTKIYNNEKEGKNLTDYN